MASFCCCFQIMPNVMRIAVFCKVHHLPDHCIPHLQTGGFDRDYWWLLISDFHLSGIWLSPVSPQTNRVGRWIWLQIILQSVLKLFCCRFGEVHHSTCHLCDKYLTNLACAFHERLQSQKLTKDQTWYHYRTCREVLWYCALANQPLSCRGQASVLRHILLPTSGQDYNI